MNKMQKMKVFLRKLTTRPNINREEKKALKELRKDKPKVILNAYKGLARAVMHKEEYIKTVEELLNPQTYKTISVGPTTRQKNKFINLLENIRQKGASAKQHTEECVPQEQHPAGAQITMK